MFDVLSRGFESAKLKLAGKARLDESSLAPALREVRASLLQADVALSVAKEFVARVKEQSLGEIVKMRGPDGRHKKLTPQDHFIKACYDELVALMGPVDTSLDLTGSPSVIMMVGLQGSGKTTTTGKLARKLVEDGHKPLLVAADVYRPAAIDQLKVLGRSLDVPVWSVEGMNPVELSVQAVRHAHSEQRDVVIIDTAGRLAIDNALMEELVNIRANVNPANVLFVCDAMTGQDSVVTAKEFDRRLDFSGFVLTKLDGDARGGAALSIKAVTGKPIKFLGQGEELDKLEEFRPEGLAQRILGFGDVVGLMQDFEKHVDREEAERDAQSLLRGSFSYSDFIKQLNMLRKMGSMRSLLARMPGMSGLLSQIPEEALDEREMDRTMAIVQSMTRQERDHPEVLDESRFQRISGGCGRTIEDVRELHQRFLQAREMMKGLGGMMGGGGGLPGMGGFPGMGGLAGAGAGLGGSQGGGARKQVSAADRIARRKKQKASRKARKRNRKR